MPHPALPEDDLDAKEGQTHLTPHIVVTDAEDANTLWARALEAGAEVRHELADQFWGERHGQLVDPFGHRWNVAQQLRDISPEELAAAAAEAFGGGG
jgi:uncharacterized glyoxalase superfamily protein PhnB